MKKLKIVLRLISIGIIIYILFLLAYWYVAFEPFTHDFAKWDGLQRFFYLVCLVMLIPISAFVRDAVPILFKLGRAPRVIECPKCNGARKEDYSQEMYNREVTVFKVPCGLCKGEGTIVI